MRIFMVVLSLLFIISAIGCGESGANHNLKGAEFLKRHEYQRAIDEFSQAIRKDKNYPFPYNNRGLAYLELNKYDKALADFNMAIGLNPLWAEAYYNRGNAYAQMQQYEKSVEDYSVANTLYKRYYHLSLHNSAMSYSNMGEYEKAVEDFTLAILIDSSDYNSYLQRGIAYAKMGLNDQAKNDFRKILEESKEPGFVNAATKEMMALKP